MQDGGQAVDLRIPQVVGARPNVDRIGYRGCGRAATEVGNRSPGQPAVLQLLGVRPVSLPATNRLMPSS